MSRRRDRTFAPERAPRVELAVDDLDDSGRGVGRVEGKVVFVTGALPGERVRARYLRSSRRADEATVEAVLAPSPARTEPFCPVFARCGGCTLQHWDPAAQRAQRERRVHEQLARAAGAGPERWLDPITGPERGYRMRARWACHHRAGRGLALGFREAGGRRVVDADRCPILDPRLSTLMPALKRALGGLDHAGRVTGVEACASEGDTAVGVELAQGLTAADHERLAAFEGDQGVRVAARTGGREAFAPVADGQAPALYYALPAEGVTLGFALGDFVQANPAVNRGLVARAMALLAPAPGRRVLDLFAGVGNFALPAARRGAAVLGLDGDAGLVERAQDNACRNGLAEAAAFRRADLASEGLAPVLAEQAPDAVLLDPPRAGASEAVAALAAHGPRCIVYVSCEPATLARDVAHLVAAGGYRLTDAGIADMFPQTAHVEAIARLER